MNGANATGPLKPSASVQPSGGDLAATSTPSMPPAPGLFSTTTGWPQRSLSLSPRTRATTSSELPAGAGTTMRTGRGGHGVWASAASGSAASAGRSTTQRRRIGKVPRRGFGGAAIVARRYTGGMDDADEAQIAFIGGGNMASALIGGVCRSGHAPSAIVVVEPVVEQRRALTARHGVRTQAAADAALGAASLVVWAVKPQAFVDAALPCAPHVASALHASVMAGIRCDVIAAAVGATRIVRSMPNTPALIGRGIAALYATAAVSAAERARVEQLLAPTGPTLWVDREADLDAVTALSGSGPAYVFYFIEAMVAAATEMGLTEVQGKLLALATFDGATALAAQSAEPLAVLRERVTSKGGTTHAAIESMRRDAVAEAIVRAVRAAQRRAAELGDEFGR